MTNSAIASNFVNPTDNAPLGCLPQFFRLAVVNILSNLMVPLAGLLDVAFLGHLADIHHLAGVALATVVFNYIYWTCAFLRMGTTGVTAQAVGRDDERAVMLIALRNGAIALAIGLLVLLFQEPIRHLGFTLLSATDAVKASGQAYFRAMVWGAPATLLNLVIVGWFLGQGQSGKVLLLSGLNNGTKVLLDYLFIIHLGWGATGAGSATVVSQTLMMIVGLGLVSQAIPWAKLRTVAGEFLDWHGLTTVFRLNRDILIRTFFILTAFSTFTNLSAAMGTDVLASNSVMLQIITFSAYFVDGLSYATESMAGILHGQRAIAQLRQLLWVGVLVGLGIGLSIASLFACFPALLFGLLTSHADVVAQLQRQSLWLLPVLGFGAIAYLMDGYFLGLTAGKILRQAALIATLIGFAPAALAAWHWQDPRLLWLAMTLLMVGRAFSLLVRVPGTLAAETA